MYGKRKERLAREGPGGSELVVVRGFMEEGLSSTVFENYFLGLFLCIEGGLGLATEQDRMSTKNKKVFETNVVFQ